MLPIALTRMSSKRSVCVNPEQIAYFSRAADENYTKVTFVGGDTISVLESEVEIIARLRSNRALMRKEE